jgi:phospholipid transport system substrate-binding protein
MKLRRLLFCLALALPAGALPGVLRGQPAAGSPSAVVQSLCDRLIEAMKQGPALGFEGRVKLLEPEIRRDLDLPLMARFVVGLSWRRFTPDQQKGVIDAFGQYSIAVYASRFKAYSGERFVVQPNATPAGADQVVDTQLLPSGGDPVQLNYRMRQNAGAWKVIDVYLNGTISQVATQRSEFSSTLQSGGADALIRLLREKTAELK